MSVFDSYGPSVVQYYRMPSDERQSFMVNPMCEAFPRIAACHYYRYGSGGRQEMLDAICILGLNMINDKVCSCYHFIEMLSLTYSISIGVFCADISDLVVLVCLPYRLWTRKVGLQGDADVFT